MRQPNEHMMINNAKNMRVHLISVAAETLEICGGKKIKFA